ncbi:DMT family transporter [Pseudonocardia sp. D17]|uniref:DMT family transporter n=1 Tax=Pseudonocardia sp. D17 TaxID=882661 RepID=UPI0030D17DCD|nr:membrane protein [Pseudonocardia sp. D17]
MTRTQSDAAASAALVVLWSAGFIGAVLGTRAAPADTLLAWRFVIAAAILVPVAAARGARLRLSSLRRQAPLGLLSQFAYLGCTVTAVGLGVPAGTTALIAALQPLVVAGLAGPVLGEHVTGRQRVGLLAGLGGVALVVGGDLHSDGVAWWAFLLPVAGMFAMAAGTVLTRRAGTHETPLESLTIQTATTAVLFTLVALVDGRLAPPADPMFWGAVAWVVVLPTFGGFGLYLYVLRRQGATRVSSLLYLTPPTTMIWAYLMFGQVPGLLAVPGIALAAAGVWLVLRTPRARTVGAPSHDGRRERARRLLARHP